MIRGTFLYRKSRRLSMIDVDGTIVEAYTSNGSEISFLKEGATCFLKEAESKTRRTAYDLYSVYDHETLVCIDAKEPLYIAKEWCTQHYPFATVPTNIRFYEEYRSMLLFDLSDPTHSNVVQVMGSSLAKNRKAYLPEIPSKILNQRLSDLLYAKEHGQNPYLLFVVCREDADSFSATEETDPYFADLLEMTQDNNIPIQCLRCSVNENGMYAKNIIPLV